MTPLLIKETKHTPRVLFDEESFSFEVTGVSRPEDVELFYTPIFEWIDLEAVSIVKNCPLVKIDFTYFNSATTKILARLFRKFATLSNNQCNVIWYYDHDDDEALEAGKDFAQISQMPFQFIAK